MRKADDLADDETLSLDERAHESRCVARARGMQPPQGAANHRSGLYRGARCDAAVSHSVHRLLDELVAGVTMDLERALDGRAPTPTRPSPISTDTATGGLCGGPGLHSHLRLL